MSKTTISTLEKQNWIDNVMNKPKLDFLASIKPAYCTEPYLKLNIPRYERSLLSQLRYGILQIQLETGESKEEARVDRHCKVCNGGVVEDQYHFVFKCPVYAIRQAIFIEKIKEKVNDWDTLNDTDKFITLFNDQPRLLVTRKYIVMKLT